MDYQYQKMMSKYNQCKTGNIAMDMITEALAFYKSKGKKIKIISLSSNYWRLFLIFMRKQKPDLFIDDDGLQFNNVLIRKGHRFMAQNIEFEFEKKIILADA